MSFLDTLKLALRNLGQAKLRSALTMLGVSIGIASLSGMVSLGVGLEEQVVGSFSQSGVFDSITITPAPIRLAGRGRFGGGGRGGNAGRGGQPGGRDTAAGTTPDAATPPAADTPRARLDDETLAKIAAMEHVKAVYPNLRVPVQVGFKEFSDYTAAAGVPMTSASDGVFKNITHGSFFPNDVDDACMLSLDMAKRLTDADPKTLIGQNLTLTYAVQGTGEGPKVQGSTSPAGQPDDFLNVGEGVQVRRIELPCPIVGIVERESAPGIGGSSVSPLMIPLAKARAIELVQVTNAQSLLRRPSESRAYTSVTVKVTAAQHTQDVQDKIKAMGLSAFSLNDLLQNAKRAFIIFDIILSVIGSIALAVSSLGIVNTMVMSILERTREIGIMKAIGGSDRDIRKIFLIEATTIGVLGGMAGVALGWVVGRLVNFGANIYIARQGGTAVDLFSLPLWLIGGAIGFSILISLLAGSYPARRAARLDPIQALRHD